MNDIPWTHRGGHRYIRKSKGNESWAGCTCGWEETGARAGDKEWREAADRKAWEVHRKGALP